MRHTAAIRSTTTTPAAPLQPLLTERAAADLLAVSPRTLQAWRIRGGGPRYVKIAAAVRYRPEDLAAFIDSETRRHTADTGAA